MNAERRFTLEHYGTLIVDEEDADLVESYTWTPSGGGRKYLKGWIGNGREYMHRLIMVRALRRALRKGELVDHINRRPSDNRRSNLRLATKRTNRINTDHVYTSRFTGVCWAKHNRKWKASVHFEGRGYQLGYYREEEEAARAYDSFLQDRVPNPHLNFPEEETDGTEQG